MPGQLLSAPHLSFFWALFIQGVQFSDLFLHTVPVNDNQGFQEKYVQPLGKFPHIRRGRPILSINNALFTFQP